MYEQPRCRRRIQLECGGQMQLNTFLLGKKCGRATASAGAPPWTTTEVLQTASGLALSAASAEASKGNQTQITGTGSNRRTGCALRKRRVPHHCTWRNSIHRGRDGTLQAGTRHVLSRVKTALKIVVHAVHRGAKRRDRARMAGSGALGVTANCAPCAPVATRRLGQQ